MKLATWTHPKTGEVRIYVNGSPFQSGAKIHIERCDANKFGDDWRVVVKAGWAMDVRTARDEAADAVESMVGHRCTFDQILTAAA